MLKSLGRGRRSGTSARVGCSVGESHAAAATGVAPLGTIIADGRGVVEAVNRAAEVLLGRNGGQIIGRELALLLAPSCRETFRRAMAELRESNARGRSETSLALQACHPDGRMLSFNVAISRLATAEGDKFHFGFVDAEAQPAAFERLQLRERQLEQVQRLGHIGHWVVDLRSASYEGSEGLRRIFGLPKHEPWNYARVLEAIHEEDRERGRESRRRAIAEGRGYDFAFRIRRPDGSVRHVEGRTEPIFDTDGAVCGFFGVTRDITDRMRANAEQRELAARLRTLSRRLLEVREEERRQLAHTLHDELGQSLTVLKFGIDIARQRGAKALDPKWLNDSVEILDDMLRQLRDLALDLRPPILDQLGLQSALQWYVSRLAERTGINMQFYGLQEIKRAQPEVETACYRIAQEALANVVRHSRARLVEVDLQSIRDMIILSIRDDGVGFDVSRQSLVGSANTSFGLHGMEEQALLAGGTLVVDAAPGSGVTIIASFPHQ